MLSTNDISPVKTSERYVILDALRGFALLGICMANFPEFSLYTFLSPETVAAMPTAVVDRSHRISGLPVSNAVQPSVAFRLQIRSVGMDMADADIRKMAQNKRYRNLSASRMTSW